jgi:Cu/Ag efflux pump CusA
MYSCLTNLTKVICNECRKKLDERSHRLQVLTGLMVLLFLGDTRGAMIVIMTIPTSIISGILFLYLSGQTINIMTLSGLS